MSDHCDGVFPDFFLFDSQSANSQDETAQEDAEKAVNLQRAKMEAEYGEKMKGVISFLEPVHLWFSAEFDFSLFIQGGDDEVAFQKALKENIDQEIKQAQVSFTSAEDSAVQLLLHHTTSINLEV